MRLQDKVCIITGGGRGLGRDFAFAFTREGAQVVIAGTTEPAINATAEELRGQGHRALSIVCDVADEAAVARMVATTLREFGRIDVLINNAGVIGPTAVVTEVSRAD